MKLVVTVTKPAPRSHRRRASRSCRPRVRALVDVFPFLTDAAAREQRGGVISFEEARILAGEIEGIEHPAVQGIEGLLLEAVEARDGVTAVRPAFPVIEGTEQGPAVVETAFRQVQAHVLLEVRAGARDKRGKGPAEFAGGLEVPEVRDRCFGRWIDRAWEQGHIGGHGGVDPGGAGYAGVERAHVGPEGVRTDERFDVVIPVTGGERAYDAEFVGQSGEPREGAAEGDSGQGGFDFAGGAADVRWRVHLRIEGLEL